MEKKLNLHDLFGFLFPGAVLCATAYVFLVRIGKIAAGHLDWSATLAMLPIAYVVGLWIHQFSSRFMHEQDVALTLMHDSDITFTLEFKRGVKTAFEDLFKLPASGDRNAQQMMFNGCYDYVIQQGKGIYVEHHYATYSLCRSMVFVSMVAGTLACWLVVREPTPLSGTDYFSMLVIVAGTTIAVLTFWRAKDRFIKIFAAAVYRAFYSAYCDCKMPCKKAAAEHDGE